MLWLVFYTDFSTSALSAGIPPPEKTASEAAPEPGTHVPPDIEQHERFKNFLALFAEKHGRAAFDIKCNAVGDAVEFWVWVRDGCDTVPWTKPVEKTLFDAQGGAYGSEFTGRVLSVLRFVHMFFRKPLSSPSSVFFVINRLITRRLGRSLICRLQFPLRSERNCVVLSCDALPNWTVKLLYSYQLYLYFYISYLSSIDFDQ